MKVEELVSLTKWIKENVLKSEVVTYYKNIANELERYRAKHITKITPTGVSPRKEVFETINIDTQELTQSQIDLLKKLNIWGIIGEAGVENLSKVFSRNNFNEAVNYYAEANHLLGEAAQYVKVIDKYIEPYFTDLIEPKVNPEEVLTNIIFTGEAKLQSMKDLKSYGEDWYDIARGFTLLIDRSPEDFRIIGANNGSVILEMAIYALSAKVLGQVVLKGLEVAKHILEIRIALQTLKATSIGKQKEFQTLESVLDVERSSAVDKIVKEFTVDKKNSMDGEKEIALHRSVEKLVKFLSKGGQIEFIAREAEDKEEKVDPQLTAAIKELVKTNKEIQKMLLEQKRLE